MKKINTFINTYPLVHNFDKKAVKSFIEASPSFSGLYSATNLDVIPLIVKYIYHHLVVLNHNIKKDFDSFVKQIKAKSLSQRNYSKRNLKSPKLGPFSNHNSYPRTPNVCNTHLCVDSIRVTHNSIFPQFP